MWVDLKLFKQLCTTTGEVNKEITFCKSRLCFGSNWKLAHAQDLNKWADFWDFFLLMHFVCDSFSSSMLVIIVTVQYFSLMSTWFTSAQYCCLVSESMLAKPPRTRAFIRDLCTELDSRWRGGLRLANCLARFHQLSHWTTMLALIRGRQSVCQSAASQEAHR